MLSAAKHLAAPSSQILRGVYPERSEWAQDDSVRSLRLMPITRYIQLTLFNAPNIFFHFLGGLAGHAIEGREIVNAGSADRPD